MAIVIISTKKPIIAMVKARLSFDIFLLNLCYYLKIVAQNRSSFKKGTKANIKAGT